MPVEAPNSTYIKEIQNSTSRWQSHIDCSWETIGNIHADFLPNGTTVTADYYSTFINERALKSLNKNRPSLLRKDVILQRDNSRPHTARKKKKALDETAGGVLQHATAIPIHTIALDPLKASLTKHYHYLQQHVCHVPMTISEPHTQTGLGRFFLYASPHITANKSRETGV
jgi:hypothetical protein